MSLTDHVQISITVDNVGITRAGYGVPLILSHNATWPERARYFTSLPAVVTEGGFATDSPEYRDAAALFSQSPRPPKIAIGRAANKPTQVYQVAVLAVRNSYKYQLRVKGQGVTATTVEYTSDSTATDAEIAAGLVTALQAVVGRNFAATGSASPISITGSAAGNWFSVEVVNPADLRITQTHADPGVAADLTAIALAVPDWYCLLTSYNSAAYVAAAAAWVEANTRIYAFDTNDSASILDVAGGGDILDALRVLGYSRTMGCYHPDPSAKLAAGWMGRWLPTSPGGATAKFKTLEGVSSTVLSGTHKTNLRDKRGNFYELVAGRPITMEGTVFSSIYGYLDVRRDVDWLEDEVSKSVFGALAGADKVPYDDSGITMIQGAVSSSVELAVRQKVLNEGSTAVEAPDLAEVAPADKASRTLRDVKFSGVLTGAIHKVIPVSGVISF